MEIRFRSFCESGKKFPTDFYCSLHKDYCNANNEITLSNIKDKWFSVALRNKNNTSRNPDGAMKRYECCAIETRKH